MTNFFEHNIYYYVETMYIDLIEKNMNKNKYRENQKSHATGILYANYHNKDHPVCEVCEKKGIVKAVEEVHHIVPLSEGGTHSDDNLMSLCKSCHSKITAKEGGRWRKNYKKIQQATESE